MSDQAKLRRLFARASWCHARARAAELLDEHMTADELAIAELVATIGVELAPATAVDAHALAQAYVLHLARHARS